MNTCAETLPEIESTSAGGALLAPVRTLIIGLILSGPGTSGAQITPFDPLPESPGMGIQTTSGAALPQADRTGSAIGKLRRLSGLTWDELAKLFRVSPRSLHFWASGRAMSSANEEHLQRALGVILRVDRGTARANRAALLSVRDDGVIPCDLLADGEYEAVVSLLGEHRPSARVAPPPLSDEARAVRTPRPPEERVSEVQDRVHREAGRGMVAKRVRTRGGH